MFRVARPKGWPFERIPIILNAMLRFVQTIKRVSLHYIKREFSGYVTGNVKIFRALVLGSLSRAYQSCESGSCGKGCTRGLYQPSAGEWTSLQVSHEVRRYVDGHPCFRPRLTLAALNALV